MRVPDIPPKAYTLSAVVVGYLLIDDMSSYEQNILGNWLMLVAQVLCTNAYFKGNINAKNGSKDIDIVYILEKMEQALNNELKNLRNDK